MQKCLSLITRTWIAPAPAPANIPFPLWTLLLVISWMHSLSSIEGGIGIPSWFGVSPRVLRASDNGNHEKKVIKESYCSFQIWALGLNRRHELWVWKALLALDPGLKTWAVHIAVALSTALGHEATVHSCVIVGLSPITWPNFWISKSSPRQVTFIFTRPVKNWPG